MAPSVVPMAPDPTKPPIGCYPRGVTEVTVSAEVPPESAGAMTPAEREPRWALSVRFAIKASSGAEAGAILGQVLDSLNREPSLVGEPTIAPLRNRDGIWVVRVDIDVRGVAPGESAESHCRFAAHHFGPGVLWTSRHTDRLTRWDWPADIWSRPPEDDVLLHPAVQAVMILCEAQKA